MTQKIRLLLGGLGIIMTWVLLIQSIQAQMPGRSRKKLILFPVMARSVETSWSFGGACSYTFRMNDTDTGSRTSNLQAAGVYSLKNQLIGSVKGAQYFKDERHILYEQVSFSSFPDKFWGIGKATPDSAEERYQFKQAYVYLHFMKQLAPALFAGLLYEYQQVWNIQYQAGGLFDRQEVKGRMGYHISGLGLSITYDTRNHAFSPDKGLFAQFYFNHFSPVTGSDFTYTNLVLDIRKYMALGKGQVLAVQAYGSGNLGTQVPLRSLAAFGGASNIRGYYEGRFRDLQQFFLQGEYRLPVHKRLGMVVFAGAGNVARTIPQLNFHHLKYSIGGGFRVALNKAEKLNLRIDYGVGRGGNSGFYFQLAEAF